MTDCGVRTFFVWNIIGALAYLTRHIHTHSQLRDEIRADSDGRHTGGAD
jgi:hypothetical protein